MPLFGHKNKNSSDTTANTARSNEPARDYSTTTDASGTRQPNVQGGAAVNDPATHTMTNQPPYGATANQAPYGASGTDTGIRTGATQQQQSHEAPLPQAIGSAALREQAMLRDRQAQGYQAQSLELAEAEQLEQKAREHRERAVAQGAHPLNKNLGGQGSVEQRTSHASGGNF